MDKLSPYVDELQARMQYTLDKDVRSSGKNDQIQPHLTEARIKITELK